MPPDIPYKDNPAAFIGVLLAEMAKNWRDKATYILTPDIQSFGDWVEQLIAESTEKKKKGSCRLSKNLWVIPCFTLKTDSLLLCLSLDRIVLDRKDQ